MKYFPFHLGDFISHTMHLSNVEELAYIRMMMLYYQTEKPLPIDPEAVARKIRLCKQQKAVDQILSEFFTKTSGGYINKRCDIEIKKYKEKGKQQSEAGKASAISRKQKKIEGQRTFNGRSTNVQPTKNQEPLTIKEFNKKDSESKTSVKKGLPTGVLDSMKSILSKLPAQAQ